MAPPYWFFPPTEADDLEAIPLGPVPPKADGPLAYLTTFVKRYLGAGVPYVHTFMPEVEVDRAVTIHFDKLVLGFDLSHEILDETDWAHVVYNNDTFYHSDLPFASRRSGHCAGMPQVWSATAESGSVVVPPTTFAGRTGLVKKPP